VVVDCQFEFGFLVPYLFQFSIRS